MTEQHLIAYKLKSALAECLQHQQRLHRAMEEAVTFEPLKIGSDEEFTEEQIRTLDQLLFRFGKLQDAIGTRLLPATLQLVQEWRDNEPFIDKLNRAEKLGILPSVEQWQMLREICNQTAQEYPDQPDRILANLRLLISMIPDLEQAHQQMADWAQRAVDKIVKGKN